jgi:hypothetical protein
MLGVLNDRRHFYKKNMMDYCLKSTEDYIQRTITREKNQKTKDIVKIIEKEKEVEKTNLQSKKQIISHVNGLSILGVLSISSFIYVFYNRK